MAEDHGFSVKDEEQYLETPRLCPDCGDYTPTFGGWAQVDRCASCGRVLDLQPAQVRRAIEARRLVGVKKTSSIAPSAPAPVRRRRAAPEIEEAGS
jgi:hypothetical protein